MRTIDHWINGALVAVDLRPHRPGLQPRHRASSRPRSASPRWRRSMPRWRPPRPPSRRGARRRCPGAPRSCSRFRDLSSTHRDEIAELVSLEHGKVPSDAAGELARGIENIEFACGIPRLLKGGYSEGVSGGVDVYSIRQPLGRRGGHHPVQLPRHGADVDVRERDRDAATPSSSSPARRTRRSPCSWPSCSSRPACPTACSTSSTATRWPSTGSSTHPDIEAVSFVGSTPIAQYIYATGTANGKRVQALGGAKNHMVVLPDADINMAADAAVSAAYGSAGERCMAISVVVAVGGVGDPLVDAITERLPKLKVGPGTDPTPRWARSSPGSTATRSPPTSSGAPARGRHGRRRRPRCRPARRTASSWASR